MTTSEIINPNFEEKYLTLSRRIVQFTALHLIQIRHHRGTLSIFQFQSSVMKSF